MKTLKIVLLLAMGFMMVVPGVVQATYPDSCLKAQLNGHDILQKLKCFWDMMIEVWRNGGLIGPDDPDVGGV